MGLGSTTYYHWRQRATQACLTDHVRVPERRAVPAIPSEVSTTASYARQHPLLGYKRLAYALMAENQAFLRPWMVHDILTEAQLLGRRAPEPEPLVRPPEADHPDQRWHTDLLMWWFDGRWFWLSDVLDAYSRYLVHCELLLTATTEAVVLAGQRALETLGDRPRRPGEPEIVHDGGVRTHPYHPQSNGRDERVHRTLREEISLDENANLYQARDVIAKYRTYYNERRPHSVLHYLCPRDYYRGNPAKLLAEGESKLRAAAERRRQY
ncbi:MAG: integrase core domain-containing protein [Chloroflexi bacterium]|nr:integrase core domain-containing protein [Chloroflexota bacterium]